jgi:hypothetical protein
MPVTYDASDLLKCTVSFSYTRYSAKPSNANANDPTFANYFAQLANNAVDNATRVDFMGDLAGGFVLNSLRQ